MLQSMSHRAFLVCATLASAILASAVTGGTARADVVVATDGFTVDGSFTPGTFVDINKPVTLSLTLDFTAPALLPGQSLTFYVGNSPANSFYTFPTVPVPGTLPGTETYTHTFSSGYLELGSATAGYTFGGFNGTSTNSADGILGIDVVASGGISGSVPEISTWAMLMLGFCGVGLMAYRRKKESPLLRFS